MKKKNPILFSSWWPKYSKNELDSMPPYLLNLFKDINETIFNLDILELKEETKWNNSLSQKQFT